MQPKTVYIRQKVDRKEPTRLTSSNGQNYEVKGSGSQLLRLSDSWIMSHDPWVILGSIFSLRVRFWVVQGNAPIRKTIAIVNKNSSNNYQVISNVKNNCSADDSFEMTHFKSSNDENKQIISVFNTSNCSCDTKIKWSAIKDCFVKKGFAWLQSSLGDKRPILNLLSL